MELLPTRNTKDSTGKDTRVVAASGQRDLSKEVDQLGQPAGREMDVSFSWGLMVCHYYSDRRALWGTEVQHLGLSPAVVRSQAVW